LSENAPRVGDFAFQVPVCGTFTTPERQAFRESRKLAADPPVIFESSHDAESMAAM
jgi:hypothetical protein